MDEKRSFGGEAIPYRADATMKERILITGASGVIGKVLMASLVDHFDVYGVDKDFISFKGRLFQADLSEYTQIERVIGEISSLDFVLHLAADSHGDAPWESVLKNNIIATRNVYESVRRNRVKRVIFASSNHVTGGYEGIPPVLHMSPSSLTITTKDPIRPDSDYGTSKAFGEAIARQYYELYDIESVCLRIGTVLQDDNPTKDQRYLKTWLSHRDLVQLVKNSTISKNVKFGIYYGVSNNRDRFWDISNAEAELDFHPQDDASRVTTGVARQLNKIDGE